MSEPPKHSRDRVLLLAEERIRHPTSKTSYEYHVGSWACTMLSKHFCDDFLITPEMFLKGTNKKPDFTIERFCEKAEDRSEFHAVLELKKKEGDYFDKALGQAAEAIGHLSEYGRGFSEIFVIVQRGMEIGFFESLSYTDMLNDKGITHFKNCVPMTDLHKDLLFENDEAKSAMEKFVRELPDTVEALLHSNPGRKSTASTIDADEVDTPCVFNLAIHKDEIDFLFHYIATQKPRELKEN